MSSKKGDKSRHNRVRRRLIARREAMRALRAAVTTQSENTSEAASTDA